MDDLSPDMLEQSNASQLSQGEGNEQNTFSILVATDNHLGYLEKDPVRGDDSFKAFEEILKLAAESEASNTMANRTRTHVDMILLGGDLFHDNKPSRKTLYNTTRLLKQYCLGDKPISLEFLSEPTDNFPEGIENVNYMDANLNIAIPVFSIHGNHDDPAGDGNLCALDQLAMNGLVNYFGRSQEIDNVVVKPILLQKGVSRLALFGIGNIRDERLHQTFLRRNVKLMRPEEDEEEEPWYNMLVLHQNRVMHGPKSYIPEAFLDDFINLVIWGHEHECLIDPVYNPQQGFHVSQPGSSVATSLSEGESKEKHVALLKICRGKFKLDKIRLASVRPFIMGDLVLADHQIDPTNQQKVNSLISRKVRELVEEAKADWLDKNKTTARKRRKDPEDQSDEEDADQDQNGYQQTEVPKPLVRLKVEYSGGYEIINPQRFGQEFVDTVANPRDIVQFYRRKIAFNKTIATMAKAEIDHVEPTEKLDTLKVENLVQKYLSAQNLSILPEMQLADAVRIYVEKDEKDAVKDFVVSSLDRMQKVMRTKQNIELEEALLKEINKEKNLQAEKYARDHPNGGLLDHKRAGRDEDENDMDVDLTNDEDEESMVSEAEVKKPRGRAAPRAKSPRKQTAVSTGSSNAKRPVRKATNPPAHKTPSIRTRAIVADDSHDEDAPEEQGVDDDDEYQQPVLTRSRSPRKQAHVILDSEDEASVVNDHTGNEDEDDDFLVPKAGIRAKGKARAKSPPKPKAAPKSRATAASKKTAAAAAVQDQGTSANTRAAPAPKGRAGAQNASQISSQGSSQAPSRLVASIGSRKKKLF
ncbi:Double-strand break repair protein mre11a [Linnemannia gamsii]|uniref:Double-strand break repair protein n=1 Tax=Linnemannia gamsii TaxID=64522 RepID=A0ABQ7JX76_9FUNG|nr:Double-strand break repair protein mre11a [Linnemannia gamsii]